MKQAINPKAYKAIYALNCIPYAPQDTIDLYMSKEKAEELKTKLESAPERGVLLVSGTALPIVNFLFSSKPFFGVDFVKFYEAQFAEDKPNIPQKNRNYYIYNIGKEPAKNLAYSTKLLESLMAKHKDSFIILETSLSKTEFERQYQLHFPNALTIRPKKEAKWV